MNQAAIDWILDQNSGEPARSSAAGLFDDIPIEGNDSPRDKPSGPGRSPVTQQGKSIKGMFDDIPIDPVNVEQEPTLWGQFKAGGAELLANIYGGKAMESAEQYSTLKADEGSKAPTITTRPGLLGFGITTPKQRKSKLEQYRTDVGESLTSAREYQNYAQNQPMPESVQKFLNNESENSWWDDFTEAPVEIATNLTARSGAASLVSMGAGMVGGFATMNPLGAMAASGAASGKLEYISSIMQGLQEQNIDLNDPDKFIEATNNPEVMDPIKEKALKRGIAIGALDGAAGFLGGKVIAPKGMFARSAGKAQLINLPAQAVAQGALGAGGEALGQYWSEGEISDPRGVAAEAIGELTFAPVEAGGTLLAVTRGTKGIAADRLKATNELIDVLVKKRQKAYTRGDREQIQTVSEDLNQYLKLRDDLQQQIKQPDTEALLQSEQMLNKTIDKLDRKIFSEKDPKKLEEMTQKSLELKRRREQITDALNTGKRTRLEPTPLGRAEALADVKRDREQYKDQLRQEDEAQYQRSQMNPLAAASEAERQAAAQGGDALEQQLAASQAFGAARSHNELADETVAAEQERAIQDEIDRLNWQYVNSTGAKRIVLGKQIQDLQAKLPGQEIEQPAQGLLNATPSTPEQPEKPRSLYDIVAENRERIAQRHEAEVKQQQEQQQEQQQKVAEAHQLVDEGIKRGLINNEPIARAYADKGIVPGNLGNQIRTQDQLKRQEKQQDQREAFVKDQQHRKKVQKLESYLEDQRKEREYDLATRQAQEAEQAVTEDEIHQWEERLGVGRQEAIERAAQERVARQHLTTVEQLQNQIERLEQHIEQGQQANKTRAEWTAEQPQPGAMPQQAATPYTPDVSEKPEKLSTSDKPVQKTEESIQVDEDAAFEDQLKQIGKEWIKDKQHRFYFNDIIKDLAGTDRDIPGNAKLWYDKRTGFYGSENLDESVYESAIERLELLRQSIVDEHGEQALKTKEPAAQEPTTQATENRPADYGKNNKIFTEDKANAAREVLRKKLAQLNSGFDPEMAAAGLSLAGYHIEAGARKFADFTRTLVDELGEGVKPYLKSFYESARLYPGFEASRDMDNHDYVVKADIDQLLQPQQQYTDEQVVAAEDRLFERLIKPLSKAEENRLKLQILNNPNIHSVKLAVGTYLSKIKLQLRKEGELDTYKTLMMQGNDGRVAQRLIEYREQHQASKGKHENNKTTKHEKRKTTNNDLSPDYGAELDGYSVDNEDAKASFLKEAKRTLTRLGKSLGWESGYKNKSGVSVNEAGIDGSGIVYGKWFVPDQDIGVEVQISGNLTIPGTKPHPQNVSIMWRTTPRKGQSHTNQWESFDISLDELAGKIQRSVEHQLSRQQQTSTQITQPSETTPNPKPKTSKYKDRTQILKEGEFNEPLTFGRHKGKTINQIAIEDRGYLRWLDSTEVKRNKAVAEAASNWLDRNGMWSDEELNQAADRIRTHILNADQPDRHYQGEGFTIDVKPLAVTFKRKLSSRSRQLIEDRFKYRELADVLTVQEMNRLKKLSGSDTLVSPPITEQPTNETTGATGDRTLERVSPNEVQEVSGKWFPETASRNSTGQGRRQDHGTEQRGSGDELGGSPTPGVQRTDLHGAGTVTEGEVGTGGRERTGGINSDSVDHSITAKSDIEGSTFKESEKFSNNIAAIKLLKELSRRPATAEQKKILAKYVGWGGLKQAFFRDDGSTRKGWEDRAAELKALLTEDEYKAARASVKNAHYTSWDVVNPIFAGLQKLGFTGGRILEPSVGVGNFLGMMPTPMRTNSRVVGVELDTLTGGIAQKLYGNSARIHAPRGFQDFELNDGSYDLVIGNPPFGDETITDNKRKDISGQRIHNYFFLKGMKALRPGGVMAMVVSKGFMDSTRNQNGRDMMFREAKLLGAFRLPNEAFQANAKTDVTTDIIFLQKRMEPLAGPIDANNLTDHDYRNRAEFTGADGNTMKINQYFVENPDRLLGDMIMNTGRFGPDLEPAMTARSGFDWKKALQKGLAGIEGHYTPEANVDISNVTGTPDASTDLQRAEIGGLYISDSGELYRRLPNLEGETQGEPVRSYTNRQGREIELKPGPLKKLKEAVRLARTARHLINMQVTDRSNSELAILREQLNREYDAFVKKHHRLNRPLWKSLLNNVDLTISPLLFALENGYKKEVRVNGKVKTRESSQKADIFSKRTQEPWSEVTKVSSADEALIVALSQTGKVDLDRMMELSGMARADLVSQLKGMIYDDPVAGWVTRDEYLSGNVKRKLRQAREAGKGYEGNVKALEAVQPEDIPASEIITTMGAHWQTPEIIGGFWQSLGGSHAQVSFIPESNVWVFKGNEPETKHKWRTDEKKMKDLFVALLNNKAISVFKTDPITENRKLDIRATDAAMAKANEIQNEFLAWLWKDEQRREAMVRRYNDLVNTDVNRQFDGSFLSFPGKITDDIIKLRETQANAVWRVVQSKTTLLDHVVGAGKTFTMVAAAMELKRTGLAKKPLMVVPNHLVAQWAEDFARLYPNARVLAATKEDFSTHKRREMLARISTGNWDAVIMAHTSFGKMPTDPKTEQWFIRQQIKDITVATEQMREAEGKTSRSVRDSENAKAKMEEKLKKLLENTEKDQGMTWNETGIDALFVDEAHEFKNLEFFTSMNRVKNINPAGSKKAQDLFIKIQALLNRTGGRNLVFATGTPVSNSMAELYTMQRYLAYEQLAESGMNHFDAWARTFGKVATKQERTSSGKYGPVSRFSEFINLPELIHKYRGFADTINNEDIRQALAKEGKGKHIPSIKGGKPQARVAPRSLYQEAYMGMIEYRFENMPDDPKEDNPLKATNDARKAGLDMRMIYPELPDDSNSKINLAVKDMMRVYDQWEDDKGTQLVFCDLSTPKSQQAKEVKEFRKKVEEVAADDDSSSRSDVKNMSVHELYDYLQAMADEGNKKAISRLEKVSQDDIEAWTGKFDVYNDVKAKLMDRGVPEAEIAFIHNANTDTQKQDLFDQVNRGEVRFLLGSTAKMGAGTNVQERLVALHHLDAPWRPSDLEQREGRIIRQGNKLFTRDPKGFEIEILRYATEQTYDVNMWQTLEVKALFIQQLRNGNLNDRVAQDISGEAANAATMKAASSGDPRITEQVEITARLQVLDNLRKTHLSDKTNATMKAGQLEKEKASLPELIVSYERDQAAAEPKPKTGPALMTPDGRRFNKASQANDWFKQQVLSQVDNQESPLWEGVTLARYRGFDVHGELSPSALTKTRAVLSLYLAGERNYEILRMDVDDVAWNGIQTRLDNGISDISDEVSYRKRRLNNMDKEIARQEDMAREPFKFEAEYQKKVERNRELIEELGSEDEVNEAARMLPEYQALHTLTEETYEREGEDIAETLANTAMGNRANRLARRILYSKEGTEKQQAREAWQQAKEQDLGVTDKDLERAQKVIDEARARQKAQPVSDTAEQAATVSEGTPTASTQATVEEVTFTDVKDAISHALEKKRTLTADQGKIRLERGALGRWELSVTWPEHQAAFPDDHIVMDDNLAKMAGGNRFKAVGNKMVMLFPENRLNLVIRRLYNKMPLQGMVEVKNITDTVVENSVLPMIIRRKRKKPKAEIDLVKMPVSKVQQLADRFKMNHPGLKNLEIIALENTTQLKQLQHTENNSDMGGVYVPGANRAYLFAANLRSFEEVQQVLRHETFVHFAVDALPEDQKTKLINGILDAVKTDKNIAKLYQAIDEEPGYRNRREELKAEEVFAHLANNEINMASLKRLWAKVRELIRSYIGINLVRTKAELEGLIVDFAEKVASGIYQPTTQRPRDWGGLPERITPFIRFRNNSATFTTPTNSTNPTTNASRLFNTLALAENQLLKNSIEKAKRSVSSLMVPIRKGMLPSMGIRQIADTYRSIFEPMAADRYPITGISRGNPIVSYQQHVQGMQSLKSNKLADADDIDIQWGKLAKKNKAEYEQLADLMHEATLFEVFPDKAEFNEHEDWRKLIMEIAQAAEGSPLQADLKKRLMYERERRAKHHKLYEQYTALSDQAKKVYKAVEGYHEQMWQDHQKALEDKIIRSMADSDEARAFLRELKARFHEAKIKGPYFPLQRYGPFYVIAEDANGQYYREHYESEAKLYKAKDDLVREGMNILSFGLMPDFTSRKLEGVSEFADQLHIALESDKFGHVNPKVKDEIRSEINQLALQLLPDVSAAKSMIRRRKVKGYSENARRSFAYSAIHQSNRLARTVYGDQMTMELERIHDDIDAKNENPFIEMEHRTIAAQVLSELEKQHETIMNPKGSPIAAKITNAAFIWYLGASAGAGLINLSQTPLIGIPLMGGRFGYRKTTAAMMRAAKDFATHGYNKISLRESVFTLSKATKGVTADEKRMLEQLIDDGTIDTTQTSSLAQIADTDLRAEAQVKQDAWVKVNRLLGFFFHNAETANREVTALAAYRMAREEGQSHKQAVEIARKITFDSHFDYSGANRPRVMKSDWMKVFTIFKQYSQNMTYTLIRNFVDSIPYRKLPPNEKKAARKALAGILFAHATAAGTLGLPLISLIGPVLGAAFGDEDDEFRDWQDMYRNWLSDLFGKETGHAIAKGVFNSFMGTDIHSRVKIDDLWIQAPNWEMSAREESMHYLLQALGPAASAAINVFWLGPEQISEGETWKGIEKMVPKFIRDGIRVMRYSTEGATVGRGGYQAVIEEFTPWELGKQAIGLSPARLSEGYQARSSVKNMQSRIGEQRQDLMSGYTESVMEGDNRKANRLLLEIQSFNTRYPEFAISDSGLRQSLKNKYRYKDLSQSGIYLPQAQLGLLKEARFAL
ncbi:MAG: PLxRFG domain-containing protein [Shewanella sp.]|nr:PLxRFG domain-containing protein [Shewanella sp.]